MNKKCETTKKINVGQYNDLYATAEEGLQNSWEDLGLSFDEIGERANRNKEFNDPNGMSNSYFLYRKHARYIVNNILVSLGIEVEDE